MNLKPFHPFGLAGTSGGVVIEADQSVRLLDPDTFAVIDQARPPEPLSYRALYLEGQLLKLFARSSWYTGQPWYGQVRFTIQEVAASYVGGTALFGGTQPHLDWEANLWYGPQGRAWLISVPLPPDHRLAGDVGLQVNLGWVVYCWLAAEPRRPGQSQTAAVNNLFAAFPGPLPFKVNFIGDDPLAFIERVYGWLW